jgi:hypothetical protein
MNTNVNLAAPIGVMAFLGTGFIFLIAVLVLIQSLIVKKRRRAKIVLVIMLIVAGAYVAATLIFSITSQEKTLALGAEKHFCEIDCHLAYSIVNISQSKTAGNFSNQSTARGVYTIVKIKTRFDETTIGALRGNGLLYPNSRVVTLVDDRGNKYDPEFEGQRTLEAAPSGGKPLTTPLRPGESYTTDVVFDLPPAVKSATLLVHEGEWVTYLIIGHENSLLHKKTKFQISIPPTPLAFVDYKSDRLATQRGDHWW